MLTRTEGHTVDVGWGWKADIPADINLLDGEGASRKTQSSRLVNRHDRIN